MILNKVRIISSIIVIFLMTIILFPSSCKKEEEKIMKVRNDSISAVAIITARAHAAVIDIGQGITQHGHCWSTNLEPTVYDSKTENGQVNSAGPFISNLTGLLPGSKYYVKAYVQNAGNIVYGADKLSFTTLSAGLPVVTTGTAGNLTTNSATVTGNLDSPGPGISSVTDHGHCWSSETATPTIENNTITQLGPKDTTGSFESILAALAPGTLYYVRAYATNSSGTSYGATVSFNTVQVNNSPTVTTATVSSVTATSAVCGGNVTADGGATVTARGVCWNTAGNPAVTDSKTTDGSGIGSFTSSISGLSANTLYYVRAYATNSAGTGYGNEETFTTSVAAVLPTVVTSSVFELFTDGATILGQVSADGGSAVIARGVCWKTAGDPTITDNIVPGGSGLGNFSCTITGLAPNSIYSVNTYATNSVGTSYGSPMNFQTLSDDPNANWKNGDDWIDTRDDQVYGTVKIGSQVWMTDNLNYGTRINGTMNMSNDGNVQKYCYDDDNLYCDIYGGLYQWDEVMGYTTVESAQGICPSGWHVPSDGEWKELEMALGMSSAAADSIGWRGTYEAYYLFSAGFLSLYPGACYYFDGTFYQIDFFSYFWSSTEFNFEGAYYRTMGEGYTKIWRADYYKTEGYTVRCIKD